MLNSFEESDFVCPPFTQTVTESATSLWLSLSSLLSHSAVVARELGLPTIVGVTGGLMKRLKTGMRVHIDAGRGKLTILDQQD